MPANEDAKTDSTAGIVPRPDPRANWLVAGVECLDDFRLLVRFQDDTTGEVRMRLFLESRAIDGTIFEALRDPSMFNQAGVELGAITWPTGADLAPDAMYDAIRENGYWEVESD